MSNQTNLSITKPNIEVVELRIDGFADLPARKGVGVVESPEFSCFGHKWCLRVYPGGNTNSDDGNVAVYLHHRSDENIEVKCTLFVKLSTAIAAHRELSSHVYQPRGESGSSLGHVDFADRVVLLSALQQGALVIKVEMRQSESLSVSRPFVPENPIVKNIMKKFNHEESSDVVFEVSLCGADGESEEPTKFYAHTWILEDGSPTLFDLTGSDDGGDTSLTRIPIIDVEPSIFECLLRYVYGGKVKDEDLKDNAKACIDAADKYGVVHLKLEAEASLASTTAFAVDNVLDFLLYADEKNCALLKEAAMDFLVENRDEAQKLSFDNAPGYFVTDLLAAIEMKEDMRVSALRKRLHEKGLDVDGSREAMIARLRESS